MAHKPPCKLHLQAGHGRLQPGAMVHQSMVDISCNSHYPGATFSAPTPDFWGPPARGLMTLVSDLPKGHNHGNKYHCW
ncbi:hypothetical protein DPMN_167647 [Dreissena polymorpha]|uniref:Uncharacterized protein n=1 Tax=Dreissena polymorpha TaxID=45954 RepID=A0A9D4F157_DREPO|nr:hypothetical protein DPMN_167647 [Dreissena polymorpha]